MKMKVGKSSVKTVEAQQVGGEKISVYQELSEKFWILFPESNLPPIIVSVTVKKME
jgi:hypothetical protein